MNVRVRGIYSTALTAAFAAREDLSVVQASGAIADRFDADFPSRHADGRVETTEDRQGVGLVGTPDLVDAVEPILADAGRDALVWTDPAPRDAVFDGRVTETLGGGAVVDLGPAEGYLPYDNVDDRVEEGDRLRVQVREPAAPWLSDRAVLDTELRVPGALAELVRGGASTRGGGAADVVDLIASDPRDGWGVRWGYAADDAPFDALDDALAARNDRAAALDDALADAPDPGEGAPEKRWAGTPTRWVWFGRESRFALDERRREVVPTMAGHHRIKAGDDRASAAVDFAEAVCGPGSATEGAGERSDADFPFEVVTRQFGPRKGDRVEIGHGKPDGRYISLGRGEVAEYDPDGTVTVSRELSPGGTLDALGEPIEAGDVAVTKFKEGRWWYATVYRDVEDRRKGTYVNVCTPVEVFPDTVRYVDLHVDVVKHGDGRVERVDDDELDAAEAEGDVPAELAEKARSVAGAVENAL
ncbi:DUF402 domain-containing protein [Halorientalis halophila]|uniref:DUF402 domain-containing protein n=1 Tax=Halorientalis halophila TaxID=3108499 RepID=UPI00300AB2E5